MSPNVCSGGDLWDHSIRSYFTDEEKETQRREGFFRSYSELVTARVRTRASS